MDSLPKELLTLMTTFIDYPHLCRLYQCNRQWFAILSDEQTWTMLLSVHFQISPLPSRSAWESYKLYFFSAGNECYFCPTPTQLTLCEQCFSKALTVAQKKYGTNDVKIMAEKAMWSSLTFKYASLEHEKKGDITDAKFIISDCDCILEYCRYDHKFMYSKKWIDLSFGNSSEFWIQAGL
jgi:hypothetical protein